MKHLSRPTVTCSTSLPPDTQPGTHYSSAVCNEHDELTRRSRFSFNLTSWTTSIVCLTSGRHGKCLSGETGIQLTVEEAAQEFQRQDQHDGVRHGVQLRGVYTSVLGKRTFRIVFTTELIQKKSSSYLQGKLTVTSDALPLSVMQSCKLINQFTIFCNDGLICFYLNNVIKMTR